MNNALKCLLFAIGLALVVFFSIRIGELKERDRCKALVSVMKPDTIIINRTDTAFILSPPDTVTMQYTKIVTVPIESIVVDSSTNTAGVSLPYEQHHAKLDDVADVYYSGYDAKIDSAIVYNHHTTEIINHLVEVNKIPRLTLDIGAAAFYHERQVYPVAVADLRYHAPRVIWGAFGAIDPQGRWAAGLSATYRIDFVK